MTKTPLKMLLAAFVAVSAAFAGSGCSDEETATLTVFAASSLTDAFEAIAEAFEEANPGVDIEFNFAGSQVLATQLREGAAADLIATADLETMAALAEAGLVREASEFTTNNLIIATRDGLEPLTSVEGLAQEGLRLVLAAPDVPAGRYARQVIDKAAEEYGADWKERVLENIRSEETNVRAVLSRLELGEADAGFVYRSDLTDIAVEAGLAALPLPVRIAVAVVYPAALTAQPAEVILAQRFLDFLLSEEGQAILASFGFGDGL